MFSISMLVSNSKALRNHAQGSLNTFVLHYSYSTSKTTTRCPGWEKSALLISSLVNMRRRIEKIDKNNLQDSSSRFLARKNTSQHIHEINQKGTSWGDTMRGIGSQDLVSAEGWSWHHIK
jgi:hypothetical protein